MRILAYGAPALGHLLPTTAMLGELAGRGQEVHLRTLAAGVDLAGGDRVPGRTGGPARRGDPEPGLDHAPGCPAC